MNEEKTKEQFTQYLSNKVIETTVKQYLYKLDSLAEWFYDNKITNTKLNIWLDTKEIPKINSKLNGDFKEMWRTTNKQKKNWLSSPWNHWVNFNKIETNVEIKVKNMNFNYTAFSVISKVSGFEISDYLIIRHVASLLSKPFVILTGLSGSGKTKLAQVFAMWICESKEQYKIVAVGADWTNREPLLGYPNGLEKDSYVKPDSGVLDLILAAKSNTDKPYFLILDEMNLSHVERYFADFLSCMESGEKILLHSGDEEWNGVPAKISLPSNLFIIGTVNIDETTYMFSPKVLDRANVIEFRVTANEMDEYLKNSKPLNLEELTGQGSNMAGSFLDIAGNKELVSDKAEEMAGVLINFFTELKKAGAEFGYRTASEIKRFAAVVKEIEPDWKVAEIIDAAIMQKLLPKLHGSRNKLTKVIPILGGLCLNNPDDIKEVYLDKFVKNNITAEQLTADSNIKYHISFEKICRIYKNAVENGFASYAEA